MIDGELLDQAICEVARKRFYKELREAMVYSSLELAEVYGEYLKMLDKRDGDRHVTEKATRYEP